MRNKQYLMREIILVVALICAQIDAPKPVLVQINTKWKSVPFLTQISEFLAEYHYEDYWNFLDKIEYENLKNLNICTQSEYSYSLNMALKHIPSSIENLKLSIATYERLPKIHFYQNIYEAKNISKSCKNIIIIDNSNQTCDFESFESFLVDILTKNSAEKPLNWDRLYNTSFLNALSPLVYYLQDIFSPDFPSYHKRFIKLAQSQKIRYVFWPIVNSFCDHFAKLSGYRANLDVKDTSYSAMDDEPISLFGEQIPLVLKDFQPRSGVIEVDKLPKKIIPSEISFKILKLITEYPLDQRIQKLCDILKDYPLYLNDLDKIKISSKEFRDYHKFKHFLSELDLPEDKNLFINGIPVSDDASVFELISLFAKEFNILNYLQLLHLDPIEIEKILLNGTSSETHTFKLNIQSPYILWLNNVEKDSRYSGMSGNVNQFLYHNFGEPIYPVRLNIFNVVFFLDPSASSFATTLRTIHRLISSSFPIRFGIVLLNDPSSKPSTVFCRAFYQLFNQSRIASAIRLFNEVYQERDTPLLQDVLRSYRKIDPREAALVSSENGHPSDEFLTQSKIFYQKLGLIDIPSIVFNGEILKDSSSQNDLFYSIILQYKKIVNQLKKKLMDGTLRIAKKTDNTFMNGPNFYSRINFDILKPSKDVLLIIPSFTKDCSSFDTLNKSEIYFCFLKNAPVISQPINARQTIYLILNLESLTGINLLKSYLSVESKIVSRASLVLSHVPDTQSATFSDLVYDHIINPNLYTTSISDILSSPSEKIYLKSDFKKLRQSMKCHSVYTSLLNILDTTNSFIHHTGRTFGPIQDVNQFTGEDFVLLSNIHQNKYKPLFNENFKLNVFDIWETQYNLSRAVIFDLITTVISKRFATANFAIPGIPQEFRKFTITSSPRSNSSYINVVAQIDPLSDIGFKWINVLSVLKETFNFNSLILLNIIDNNEEQPVRFSRFVLQSEIMFQANEVDPLYNVAIFDQLPHDKILTLHLDTLQSWFIESKFSNCDMDNILLLESTYGCIGIYDLESIIVEGHAYDAKKGGPASGLQLVMGTPSDPNRYDTIVIHNLGYFQFKGDAGLFSIQLKAGNASENYEILEISIVNTGPVSYVSIDSYLGRIVKLDVTSKIEDSPLKELNVKKRKTGFFSTLFNFFMTPKSEPAPILQSQINIFSVSTGHMYERFMRIMVLSVLEHTKTPVKFWFLKNYVSFQFVKSIEKMAQKYQFSYEFVQYKWPHWLFKQKDKQRIIWGYKILFLDLLFPQDLERIIFVDADQIVRTDLKDLYTMDLEGAPYAYTPFCDDRSEMNRFRFWKKGYWKEHLQGKPYHISALYLIDLIRFRQMMAGDRLRGQYQMLSHDPKSLANLDQDLPNNLQDMIPIKSLPIEWLWCETWCSDSSKSRAKTIDMCNNPLTHEAKLDRAKRIAPEWVRYDTTIRELLFNTDSNTSNKSDIHEDEL